MSTDEYVPDEQDLEVAWIESEASADDINVASAEFDRFLARVRRDAWHEGMLAGDCAAYNGHTTPPNPYEETPLPCSPPETSYEHTCAT